MFHCSSFEQVKKVVMLFVLLMFSTLLQAESSGNADTIDSAAKADAGLKSADDQQRGFKFPDWPDWPERQQPNGQVIPPPPPGPYMSSALSDFSVKGPSFGHNSDRHELNKPVFKLDPSKIPMETFSPDRPWPGDAHKKHAHNSNCAPTCSPSRWMPENGYQYVKPRVEKKPFPVVENRMPVRMKAPEMNWPGSRLPSMDSAPHEQYPPHASNYDPHYNGPLN